MSEQGLNIDAAIAAYQKIQEVREDEHSVCYVTNCDKEALEMAIEALEKQIPKKPVEPQGFPRFGYCPSCRKTVTKHSSYVGCTWCLQRLDWSE